MTRWWENITVKQPTKVAMDKLSFDPDNPRLALADEFDGKNEIDVIKLHIERSDLSELLESIATSGYVDIEPMVVLGAGTKLLVLEGNRRLAALKVLSSPEIAKDVGVAIPSMSVAVKRTLSTVSVYRVLKREDARDFIGFKHINGPHRWDSIAKAQFAARWYRDEKSTCCT